MISRLPRILRPRDPDALGSDRASELAAVHRPSFTMLREDDQAAIGALRRWRVVALGGGPEGASPPPLGKRGECREGEKPRTGSGVSYPLCFKQNGGIERDATGLNRHETINHPMTSNPQTPQLHLHPLFPPRSPTTPKIHPLSTATTPTTPQIHPLSSGHNPSPYKKMTPTSPAARQ